MLQNMNTFQIKGTIGWCKCFVATESVCRAADLNIFNILWMIKSLTGWREESPASCQSGRCCWWKRLLPGGGWINGASSTMQRGFRCPWERTGEGAFEVLSRSVGNALQFLSHTAVLFNSLLQKVQMSSGGAQVVLSMLRDHRCCRVFMATDVSGRPLAKRALNSSTFFLVRTKKQINHK